MRSLPSPDAIVAALRAEGCEVVEVPGWRTNNRNHVKAPGPWYGLLVHHTGGETSDPYGYAAGILFHGRPDLPGPLCNVSIGRNGIVYMVGYGRSNHAGTCAQNTLDLLIADAMPLDSRHLPGPDAVDFNSLTWGVEVQGDTTIRPFSPEQYDALVRHGAALCRLFGPTWTGGSIAAHGEATRRKPADPMTDMPCLRRDVNERLHAGPGGDWLDMATKGEIEQLVNDVVIGVFRSPEAQGIIREQVALTMRSQFVHNPDTNENGECFNRIIQATNESLRQAGVATRAVTVQADPRE